MRLAAQGAAAVMDWTTYKLLCDRPDHWSRWMLEQCCQLLGQLEERALRLALEQALNGEPLATPPDHVGQAATQMFRLELETDERQALLAAMRKASERKLTTPHTQTRGLRGFVQAWQEYAGFEG